MSIKYFKKDLQKACSSDKFLVQVKWFVFNHTLHLVFLLRLGQSLIKLPLVGRLFAFIIEYIIRILFASDISLQSEIDKGFVIAHGHDIVIGADVVIGENCKIFNGVTLGNKDVTQTSKGSQPVIGANVVISTGAKVLGHIIVGDNVIIGANAVVLKSCEDNSTYVGIPAEKVR
jgi:serine O-acetyltransferase